MPKYVENFAEICPGVKINVYIENSKIIENKLLTNELDLAYNRWNNTFLKYNK